MSEPHIELAAPEAAEKLFAEAPEPVRTHADLVKSGLKAIPWLAADGSEWERSDKNRALALLPEVFEIWWLEEYYVIKRGSVESDIKELLALAVASRIDCHSCVPYHAGAARFEGGEDELISKIKNFDEQSTEIPESLKKIIHFGLDSVYNPESVAFDDIEAIRQLGYSNREILEFILCAHVSFKNAALNRVLNLNQ